MIHQGNVHHFLKRLMDDDAAGFSCQHATVAWSKPHGTAVPEMAGQYALYDPIAGAWIGRDSTLPGKFDNAWYEMGIGIG